MKSRNKSVMIVVSDLSDINSIWSRIKQTQLREL